MHAHKASLQLLFQLTTVTRPLRKLPEGGLFHPPEVALTTGSRELTLANMFLLHSKNNFSKQLTWLLQLQNAVLLGNLMRGLVKLSMLVYYMTNLALNG